MTERLFIVEVFFRGKWHVGPALNGRDDDNNTLNPYALSSLALAEKHREGSLGHCRLPIRVSEYVRVGTARVWPGASDREDAFVVDPSQAFPR